MTAKRIIKSYVGDTITVRVDLTLNGVPGLDWTGSTVEAELQTPTPVTPAVDIDGLSAAFFTLTVLATDTAVQTPGAYDLLARVTMPLGEKITVLDAIVDLQEKPITV